MGELTRVIALGLRSMPNALQLFIFCRHFLMRFGSRVPFWNKILPLVFLEFRQPGCEKSPQPLLRLVPIFGSIFSLARLYQNPERDCATGYTTCFFQFQGTFLSQLAHASCDDFITVFMNSKNDSPRHGKAMQWEAGVIKPTANRRQFSPISLNRGRKQVIT